jgi:hypothetical protein
MAQEHAPPGKCVRHLWARRHLDGAQRWDVPTAELSLRAWRMQGIFGERKEFFADIEWIFTVLASFPGSLSTLCEPRMTFNP